MDGKQRTRFIVGLVMIALGAFLLTSLFTHDPTEGPFADFLAGETDGNACGPAGAWVSAHMLVLLGWTLAAALGAVVLTRRRDLA